MNDSRGLKTSHLVALGGAMLALASLWAPWYRIDLGALQDALQQRPGLAGSPVGSFLQSLAALLPRTISGDAWEVFTRLDALVAVVTVAAIAALLAAAGAFGAGIRVAREAAARVAVGGGAVAVLFVAGRILDPPGPNAYLDVRWGAWACLIGCALMVGGGAFAAANRAGAT